MTLDGRTLRTLKTALGWIGDDRVGNAMYEVTRVGPDTIGDAVSAAALLLELLRDRQTALAAREEVAS